MWIYVNITFVKVYLLNNLMKINLNAFHKSGVFVDWIPIMVPEKNCRTLSHEESQNSMLIIWVAFIAVHIFSWGFSTVVVEPILFDKYCITPAKTNMAMESDQSLEKINNNVYIYIHILYIFKQSVLNSYICLLWSKYIISPTDSKKSSSNQVMSKKTAFPSAIPKSILYG